MEQAVAKPSYIKPIVIAAILIGIVAAVLLSPLRQHLDPAAAEAWLNSVAKFWWAPLLFIGLYCVFNVLLIPATILSLTAGVLWGGLRGGLWVLAAATVASAIPYFIARSGSGFVGEQIKKRAGGLYEKLRKEGFTTLLLLRLVPIAPYNILNYVAGLAGIKPRDYILATFFGTIPGIFIFTNLAASIKAGVLSPRDAFVRILIAGASLGALVLVSRLLAGKVRSRLEKNQKPETE